MRSNLRERQACYLRVHVPINDKFMKLLVCHVRNDRGHHVRDAGGGLNTGDLCDVWSAVGAAGVPMCSRMVS